MKKFIYYSLITITVITLFITSACSMNSMDNLPKGELIETVYSPDQTYKINAFLVNGGATVDFSVRCEVIQVPTREKRNIYWNYHCQEANIEWLDDTTVSINGKQLNVITDSYDWRK